MHRAGAAFALAQLMQCCRDYPGLPDPRGLTVSEIKTFYKYLVPELTRHG